MLDEILAGYPPFPPYLHRHVLQLYVIRHRRPPANEREYRRAVYEYLTRSRQEKGDEIRVYASAELEAWLQGEDEHVRGWGRTSRLAALIHQFSGELRKRYDLATERDYKEYLCYLALSVQVGMQWPERIVDDATLQVLWEAAPGVSAKSRVGVTRAIQYVRRNAPPVRSLDLSRLDDFSQMLLLVLADIEQGKLPAYTLSPAQYEYLSQPVKLRKPNAGLTGLLHHLVVERGLVAEGDLDRPDVAEALRREIPALLAGLRLPARLREAHGARRASVTPIGSVTAADTPVPMVTVVGPLSHGSGLGAAARACVEAFKSARIPVEVLNCRTDWGRTDEEQGSGQCSRVRGDINVIHFNPDVFIENLSQFGLEQFEGRYNIGFFFWETSRACLAHRLGADLVDEVWVASEYCRAMFQAVTDKPVVVVGTPVPKIADVGWANRRYFGIPEGKFTYVYTFDGASRLTRKNPMAAVRAFQRAYPADEHVQLVLKTQNTRWLSPSDERLYAELRRQAQRDRRIMVIDESFSSNEVHALISVCDCYVALHRSEGFGYGMAEAMKLRVPVIATGDSGNADFTTEATSWPVRSHRVPVAKRDFVYEEDGQEWAEPDVDHAAARMLEVRNDPGREEKLRRAHALVHTRYDEAAVGRLYLERITAIRAGLLAGVGEEAAGAGARSRAC